MTHVSLFTGIGGLDLAAEWAGFETVLQVERELYALRVLEKHWPDVPRITDVREVTSESVSGPITVVSGGFPCQPFSAAGKRRGVEDDRYLWPELLRIVEELRPAWVIGENVSGLLSIDGGMEIDRMLAALEARDYTPWILHHPAAGVGAPHKRDRVFIVANSRHGAESERARDTWREARERTSERAISPSVCEAMANGERSGLEGLPGDGTDGNEPGRDRAQANGSACESGVCVHVADTERSGRNGRAGQLGQGWRGESAYGSQWELEPDVGRVADELPAWMDEPDIPRVATGVPNRAARLKALGNAVVPAQAAPIFFAIAEVERERNRAH